MPFKNRFFILTLLFIAFFLISAGEKDRKPSDGNKKNENNKEAAEVKEDKPLDSRVTPGNRFQIEFDEFPKTLADTKSDIWVYIPTDYDPAKKYPLFLWLGEAKGHHQDRRNLVDGKKFICVSFPLYRKTGPVPEPVSAETVSRIHLAVNDAELIWPIYKKMFAKVEEIVPNIDPNIRLVGGFSNGAHCITILLNETKGEFQKYFNAYFLVEGGFPYSLKENNFPLKRCMLVMYGEKSLKPKLMVFAKQAAKCGIDTEEIEMKDVGHAFPKEYMPKVTDWINRKVLFGHLLVRFDKVKKLIKQNKYSDALSQLEELKPEVEGYEAVTKQVEEIRAPLEEKAAKESKAVLKELDSKGTTKKYKSGVAEKFLKKWPNTKAAAEIQKAYDTLE